MTLHRKGRPRSSHLGPINFKYITVDIFYCLSKPASFRLRPDRKGAGFTRGELALSISKMYQQNYKIEAETMPESTGHPPGSFLLNRCRTHGKLSVLGWEEFRALR